MSWILIIKFIVGASALISLCLNIGIIIYLEINRKKLYKEPNKIETAKGE